MLDFWDRPSRSHAFERRQARSAHADDGLSENAAYE